MLNRTINKGWKEEELCTGRHLIFTETSCKATHASVHKRSRFPENLETSPKNSNFSPPLIILLVVDLDKVVKNDKELQTYTTYMCIKLKITPDEYIVSEFFRENYFKIEYAHRIEK